MNEFKATHIVCIIAQTIFGTIAAIDGNWPLIISTIIGALLSIAGLIWFSNTENG